MELAKAYNPQEAQEKWLKFWNDQGYFHSRPDSRQPFTIVIPPPNVTGALHMGHALNNTLQDVLIRWRRMQGYNALWMPGTDHAGIATQAVVERLILQTEKKTRHEIGREELVKRIWEWKDKYEARILGQLRQLGCSCDWARTRFTLDPICARAVRETFFKMFKDGLIFRGKRLVNWDTQLQTSVADDETYTEDTKSGFWTFKYKVVGTLRVPSTERTDGTSTNPGADGTRSVPATLEYIRFSTTRPETMLGDTAVCVHPSDERYKHLIGKFVTIPLVDRDIPIIADGLLADPTLGTGCVKVTPAHDPNDYACYQRNPHIGIINILNPDGTINENGGKYKGLDRYKAREAVVADMEALGFFEGKEERVIPLKYSDRSKSPIEPYLSDQWFVKMGDLSGSPLPTGGEGLGVRGPSPNQDGIGINLTDVTIPPAVLELIAEGTARENLIIPLSLRDRLLQIAMSDPTDMDTLTKLQYMLKKDIQPILASKEQIIAAINRHYGPADTDWVDSGPASGGRKPPDSATTSTSAISDSGVKNQGANAPRSPISGLARMAIEAVENGHVTFFPERYKNSYLDWLAEKRDWCISRQLWWGHRIPVWTKVMPVPERVEPLIMSSPLPFIKALPADAIPNRVCFTEEEVEGDLDKIRFMACVAPGNEEIEKLLEGNGFQQDPDVLDTWFSSMLWPHSTLGWPEKTAELEYYYPTSVLVTSRDIITLWVARMVIAGLYNLHQVPFHQVYITVKLMDGFGETMSKSKGNGVDPLDIIDRYGADALRFLIMQISTETQDARMPVANVCPHCEFLVPMKHEHMSLRTRKINCPNCKKPFRPGGPWPADDAELKTAKQASERFEIGRNFANKIWNAARFILMNLDGYTPHAIKREELPLEDRWILSRLAWTARTVTEQLESYRFSDVARTLYDFIWSEFCDWYIEMAKGRLKGDDRATAQRMLIGVLDAIVRLIHPIMPFVAESIWSALNDVAFERGLPNPDPAAESVVIAPWPEFPAEWKDEAIEKRFAHMQELVRSVREMRNHFSLEPRTPLDTFVRCGPENSRNFSELAPFIKQLAGIGNLHCGADVAKPSQSASHVTPEFEVYVSLAGLIDPAIELKRLEKELAEKRKSLQNAEAKLANDNFVKNAPPEIVEQQRAMIEKLKKQIAAIEQNLRDLQQ